MKSFLLRLLGTIGDFLRPIFAQGTKELMEQLLPLALQTVAAIAADPTVVSNDAKRQEALVKLENKAEAIGLQVGTSMLNWAIETAVQKLKASTG